MKRYSIVLVVLLVILISAVSVYAAKPVTEVSDRLELGLFVTDCGDFDILVDTVGVWSYTYFYDEDGKMVKEMQKTWGTDTLYHEDYPENGISGDFHDNRIAFFDPGSGDLISGHYAGTPWNVHIQGVGPVYRLSGPAFFEGTYENFVKEAGKFSFDQEALCAYFAS